MITARSARKRFGFGWLLLAMVAASPFPAVASALAERVPVASEAPRRQTIVILPAAPLELAAGESTSCMCGAFRCKGKEFPACSMQCVIPRTAVCDCGFCERTMGSPNSTALGPVANICACH